MARGEAEAVIRCDSSLCAPFRIRHAGTLVGVREPVSLALSGPHRPTTTGRRHNVKKPTLVKAAAAAAGFGLVLGGATAASATITKKAETITVSPNTTVSAPAPFGTDLPWNSGPNGLKEHLPTKVTFDLNSAEFASFPAQATVPLLIGQTASDGGESTYSSYSLTGCVVNELGAQLVCDGPAERTLSTVWTYNHFRPQVMIHPNANPSSTITMTSTFDNTMAKPVTTFKVDGYASWVKNPEADDATITGTGTPGQYVVIRDAGGVEISTATVAGNGTWSATAPKKSGTYTPVYNGVAGNTFDYTVTTKFEVLTPNLSTDSGSITNGTVFTGKGDPGTTVTITDKDGNTVGQAVVDDQGNWSTPVSGLPQGPNNLGITHTVPGGEPVSQDLGGIVVVAGDEATPLMDPTIAGGTAMALLAAAGTILNIRRRRRTSTN